MQPRLTRAPDRDEAPLLPLDEEHEPAVARPLHARELEGDEGGHSPHLRQVAGMRVEDPHVHRLRPTSSRVGVSSGVRRLPGRASRSRFPAAAYTPYRVVNTVAPVRGSNTRVLPPTSPSEPPDPIVTRQASGIAAPICRPSSPTRR